MNNNNKQLRLTMMGKMGGTYVLHNGSLGVESETNQQVDPKDIKGLTTLLKGLEKELNDTTSYNIKRHPFGLTVKVEDTYGEQLKAFIGYDESIDFKLRLCYTTDTLLGLVLMKRISQLKHKPYDNSKQVDTIIRESKKSVFEEYGQESVKGLEESKAVIGNWGKLGKRHIIDNLTQKVKSLGESLRIQGVIETDEGRDLFIQEVNDIVLKDNDQLAYVGGFYEGTALYQKSEGILRRLTKELNYTGVNKTDNSIIWHLGTGHNQGDILRMYDKDKTELDEDIKGTVISVDSEESYYTSLLKLITALQANVGYRKILNTKELIATETVNEVEAPKQEGVTELNNNNSNNNELKEDKLKDTYFDIYLRDAKNWGKVDGKYEELKGVLLGVAHELDVQSMVFKADGEHDYKVDFIINNKTYVIALTDKATDVKTLELEYKNALAYDPNNLKVLADLIKDKLEELKELT